MDRVNRIAAHPLWQSHMAAIALLEQDRIFCRHSFAHLLDVARLAYIENLEQHGNISKDLIYAAALLHDIGRDVQYQFGTPHHEAGAEIAEKILPDCGYTGEEIQQIVSAISDHRSVSSKAAHGLSGLIYRADKASRMCLFCSAQKACNWSDEKKNLFLKG